MGIVYRFLSRRYTRGHSLLDITSSEIVAYLAELGAHGPTRKQSRVALRSLFGYLQRAGYRSDDPAAILDGAKDRIRRLPPSPFTPLELRQLVAAAFRRDRAAGLGSAGLLRPRCSADGVRPAPAGGRRLRGSALPFRLHQGRQAAGRGHRADRGAGRSGTCWPWDRILEAGSKVPSSESRRPRSHPG